MSGFDHVVFSAGAGSLVFQRLQTPSPKRRPLSLAWFPTRRKKNTSNKSKAVTSPDARAHHRRVPPWSRGLGPVPGVCRGREGGTGRAPRPLPLGHP